MITPGQCPPATVTPPRIIRRVVRLGRGGSRMKSRPVSRAGRPQSLADDSLIRRAAMVVGEFGVGLDKLAKILGITQSRARTLYRNDPNFRDAITLGRDQFNGGAIEKALVQRALGYEYEERTEEDVEVFGKGPLGVTVKVPAHKTTVYKRQRAPDVGAIIFFLSNRLPDRWQNRWKMESERTVNSNTSIELLNANVDLNKLGKDDLERLRDIMRRALPAHSPSGEGADDRGGSGVGQTLPA